MSSRAKTCAIILAAGSGTRMGGTVTKQKINILGRSVLYYAVAAFEACPDVDDIVVVARADEIDFVSSECADVKKLRSVTVGGSSRSESAKLGFSSVPMGTEIVAIHDAARALITPDKISAVVNEAKRTGAASAVSLVTDTIKLVNDEGVVRSTLDREFLRRAETPQVFSLEIYRRAQDACAADETITDDNMMVERIGVEVSTVDVGRENIKITTPEDLRYAEFLLRERGWTDA